MSRRAWLGIMAVVLCGAAGCGKVLDSASSRSSSPPGAGDGGASDGGALEVPPDLFARPTVWIGQVESAVTYPATVEGGGPEKVVLILDAITDSVTGTVTFGEGPLPSPDPSDVYPFWTAPDKTTWPTLQENWLYAPFRGFPYSIVSSKLENDVLSTFFAPVELWTDHCAKVEMPEPTLCECDVTGCHALDGPLRRLDLVVTGGDTMAGELTRPPANALGAVPAIKLQRVQ